MANHILELGDGRGNFYPCSYDEYIQEKNRRERAIKDKFIQKKKEQNKLEREIKTLHAWSQKGHGRAGKKAKLEGVHKGGREFYRKKAKKMDKQIKSKVRRMEKMIETLETPIEDKDLSIPLVNPENRGGTVLWAKGIGKSLGDNLLFENLSFSLLRGQRLGIVGPNGAGKTTLIRLLSGQLPPDQGEVWRSPSLKIAILEQDEILPGEYMALDLIKDFNKGEKERFRALLMGLGLQEISLNIPLSSLSLGEQKRFRLGQLLMETPDLLILDEPHNHLDIRSREKLDDTLQGYSGTLILISHDEYTLKKLASQFIIFSPQGVEKRWSLEKREALKDEIRLIDQRISFILSKLSSLKSGDDSYETLDREYAGLMRKKKDMEA